MTSVLENGRFFRPRTTGPDYDDDDPNFADSLVLDDVSGTILHIGSLQDAAVQEAKAGGARVHDMEDSVVVPGFIDAHMHLLLMGESLSKLYLGKCKNLEEIRGSIRDFAQANPDEPRILCRSWMQSAVPGEPLASLLDDLDPRPIYVDADDLHSTWCNGAALKELGVEDREDPEGGVIHRDANGKASGLLSETACMGIVWPFVSQVAPTEKKLKFLDDAFSAYIAAGYTGVVDMATDEHLWDLLLQYRKAKGPLPIWLASHWFILPRDSEAENLAQVDRAIELHATFKDFPDCRIAGIKIMVDGVVDSCTATLREPYSHNGSIAPLMWTAEMLTPVLKRANDAGLQCALHAIGDLAINTAINSLEAVGNPAGRHRIEHLELCTPEDAARLGKLGITASVQPVHTDPSINETWETLVGRERAANIFPYTLMAHHGAVLAVGTDAPTAPYRPLPNLYVATTRRSALEPDHPGRTTPQFALNIVAAFAAATSGAAYSCFADSRVGRLEPGMEANLAVIDMKWDATKLLDARVVETWYKGKRIYATGADEA